MVIGLVILLLAVMTSCEPRDKYMHTQEESASNVTRRLPLGHGVRKKGLELGCHELRSKRYISDGLCTTPRPINEVVCADWCIMPPGQHPGQKLPSIANSTALPEKWRCVDGASKKRKVKLICKDGSRRFYHVKVVKRCKCTRKRSIKQNPCNP